MRIGRIADMAQHLQAYRAAVLEGFLPPRGRVLEIGPGEGTFSKKACDWVSVNITSRASPQVLGDGQRLPFRDASFDAVVAMEVIEHVRFPYRLLAEMRRVMRPEARALLSTPNVATPVNRVALALTGQFPDDRTLHDGMDVGHIHFFTRRYFLEAVRQSGFVVRREWDALVQVLPSRYLHHTALERAFPNLTKQLIVELARA